MITPEDKDLLLMKLIEFPQPVHVGIIPYVATSFAEHGLIITVQNGSSPILVVEQNLPSHRVLKHAFQWY